MLSSSFLTSSARRATLGLKSRSSTRQITRTFVAAIPNGGSLTTRNNYPVASESCIDVLQTRTIATIANSTAAMNNQRLPSLMPGTHDYRINSDSVPLPRLQPINVTVMHMMSTMTTSLDLNKDDATSNEATLNGNDAGIPFQRSKTKTIRKTKDENGDGNGSYELNMKKLSSFDDRAQAKLIALSNAKKEADGAKAAFLKYHSTFSSSIATPAISSDVTDDETPTSETTHMYTSSQFASQTSEPSDDLIKLHEEWKQSEEELSRAYSQAIKYTSRMTNNHDATMMAERLLNEWMEKFMDSFVTNDAGATKKRPSSKNETLNKKKAIKMIHQIMSRLAPADSTESTSGTDLDTATDTATSTAISSSAHFPSAVLPRIRMPPPTSKDYINLLRAYSISKARRKGRQSEVLLADMLEVAKTLAYYYNEDHQKWTETRLHDVGMEMTNNDFGGDIGTNEDGAKRWMMWVQESVPNSKAFSLAIKCHAGSTHNESLDRILLLNHIHSEFAQCCSPSIPDIYKDDPYVLLHSIKALKNFQIKDEKTKGEEWLRRLHRFVISSTNKGYLQETDLNAGDGVGEKSEIRKIDVTSAYTTIIRLNARLRGTKGAAADARKVLERMNYTHDIMVRGFEDNDDVSTPRAESIASIDIRSNAYNLVLGLYRDSKNAEDATKAVELLQRMVEAGNKAPEERNGVPLPTVQSFEFTISALGNMSDGSAATKEAERLIHLMEDQEYLDPSIDVYNALLDVCCKTLFVTSGLFDEALSILQKLKEKSRKHPELIPKPETLALVIKACSLSERDDHEKVLKTATELFSQLAAKEADEKSAIALTDNCYYYLMKCVGMHMLGDPDAMKEKIMELFSDACQRGLCSASVLTLFRNTVSEEDYGLTVGKGRLVDGWVKNVTGPKALYTDGTKGGEGKNARRDGKSTSDWAKKQREKEARRGKMKETKKVKKFFKKMKN